MARREGVAALDAALARMFRALEARPVPQAVRTVVDQLDAPVQRRLRKAG